MKRFLTFLLTAVMILIAGAAIYMCDNYTVYNLAYIFSFVFIAVYAVLMPGKVLSKMLQVIIYTLIMTAQILFNTLVIRFMTESSTYNLYKFLGVLMILIPFIVKMNFFHQADTEENGQNV